MTLRVAGFQQAVTSDIAANVAAILGAIERAADAGAEILLTPEGSLSGYTPRFDTQAAADGLATVTAAAKARNLGLALGTCFVEGDGLCYNQIRVYRPDGDYLGFHAKILRCGTMEACPVGEINDYATIDLRTFDWAPGLTVGGLICNDFWANPQCTPMPDPHLVQQLADRGAKVIFHAVHGGRDGGAWSRDVFWPFHETNLRMRAQTGKLWVVTVDSAYPTHLPCSAPSGVVAPDGSWACRVEPVGEHLFVHTIEID